MVKSSRNLDKYNSKNVKETSDGNDKTQLVGTKKKTGEIQECVFVLENGTAKKVNVKSGIQDNTYIQILSGLKEGQEVISGPYSAISKTLNDKDKVKKVDKKDLFTEK